MEFNNKSIRDKLDKIFMNVITCTATMIMLEDHMYCIAGHKFLFNYAL